MNHFFLASSLLLGFAFGMMNCDPECQDLDWNSVQNEFFKNDGCKKDYPDDNSCFNKCVFERYGYFCPTTGTSHSDKVPSSIPGSVPESARPKLIENIQACFDGKCDKVDVEDCTSYDTFSDCVSGTFSASNCPDDKPWWN